MWSMRESNAQHTNNPTDLWEPCVCLSAFPGARFVRTGSKEAEALIKERAWYRDASLTAWGQAAWWGPDESHQTGLLPPNQQPVGARLMLHCCLLPWAPLSGVNIGIWRVSSEVKVTFSLKVFIEHRTTRYLVLRGVCARLILEAWPFFCRSSNVNI